MLARDFRETPKATVAAASLRDAPEATLRTGLVVIAPLASRTTSSDYVARPGAVDDVCRCTGGNSRGKAAMVALKIHLQSKGSNRRPSSAT